MSPWHVIGALLVGSLATLTMDAASFMANRLRVSESNSDPVGPRYIGRWIGHMQGGSVAHHDIRAAAALPHERSIGLAAHYTIGALLGAGYFAILGLVNVAPSPEWALLFGAATAVFPSLIIHPAYGLGLFGLRSGHPLRWTGMSLIGHLIFGAGIAVWTALLAPIGLLATAVSAS